MAERLLAKPGAGKVPVTWLATSEPEGEEQSYALAGFDDLGQAVEAFAARTEQAADTVERLDIGWPQVTARYLRYKAALARAGAARAELGDTIRRSRGRIRAERAVSRVAGTAGVSREFLYHILAGDDWTWKGLIPASKDVLPPRPPARLDPATLEPPAGPQTWSATVTFAVEAGSEQEASAIARVVLDQMGGPAAISGAMPGTGQESGPVPERLWTVAADFDLTGMQVEADDVEAFSDLRGDLCGAPPPPATWPTPSAVESPSQAEERPEPVNLAAYATTNQPAAHPLRVAIWLYPNVPRPVRAGTDSHIDYGRR